MACFWEGLSLGVPRAGFTLVEGGGRTQGSWGMCWPAGGWAGSCHGRLQGCSGPGLVSSDWGPRNLSCVCSLVGGAGCWGFWLQGPEYCRLGPVYQCLGVGPAPSSGPSAGAAVGSAACLLVGGAVSPPGLLLGVRHVSSGIDRLVVRSGSWCY